MGRPRSAFTLIELLVVVAIIAVLASLLMPAIGAVRDSAKGSACRSNLRQIAQGGEGYALDNDGYLNPSRMYFDPGPIVTLREFLDPYIDTGSTNSDMEKKRILWACPGRLKRVTQNPMDYGGNLNIHIWWEPAFAGGGDAKKQRPLSQGLLRDPAGSIGFADVAQASGAGTGIGIIASSDSGSLDSDLTRTYDTLGGVASQLNSANPDVGAYYLRYRHTGQRMCMVSWLDGHVSAAPRSTLVGRDFSQNK